LVLDSWYDRLNKFIPSEAIGVYLALDRAANTSAFLKTSKWLLAGALLVILIASAVANALYLRVICDVRRPSSILASTIALGAFAYGMGGLFVPLGVADPGLQAIVVIATGAFLPFFPTPGTFVQARSSGASRR